jgi:hypothetical protein
MRTVNTGQKLAVPRTQETALLPHSCTSGIGHSAGQSECLKRDAIPDIPVSPLVFGLSGADTWGSASVTLAANKPFAGRTILTGIAKAAPNRFEQ